jgi:hypothetical protein
VVVCVGGFVVRFVVVVEESGCGVVVVVAGSMCYVFSVGIGG